MRISFYIVTYNDAFNLDLVLKQVSPYVDEIIVVHDGAFVDDSKEVALNYTKELNIFELERHGVSSWAHRNFAMSKCTGDWIVTLDTDELFVDSFLTDLRDNIAKAEEEDCDHIITIRSNLYTRSTNYETWRRAFELQHRCFVSSTRFTVEGLHNHPCGMVKGLKLLEDVQLIHDNRCEAMDGNGIYMYPKELTEKLELWAKYLENTGDDSWQGEIDGYKKTIEKIRKESIAYVA